MSEGKSDPSFNGYKTRYATHKDGSFITVFYDAEFDMWRAIKHTEDGDVDTWEDFDGNTPESKAKAEKWTTEQGYVFESFRLLKNVTKLSEGKMKDAMEDLIEKAAKLVDEPEDSPKYSMLVVAKVLELDTTNLFKGDAVTAEEMVKGTLGL